MKNLIAVPLFTLMLGLLFSCEDENAGELNRKALAGLDTAHVVSFEKEVKPIIDTKCAISGCHNGDNGSTRDWTNLQNVQEEAGTIKTRVNNKSMPPASSSAGPLSDSQIEVIAQWVDQGALDN